MDKLELELDPCPFCGTALTDKTHLPLIHLDGGIGIECGNCGAQWPKLTKEMVDTLTDEELEAFLNARAHGSCNVKV